MSIVMGLEEGRSAVDDEWKWCEEGGLIMTKTDFDYLNFADDKDKMRDFAVLTKDEFLRSYSYIYEQEYDATVEWLKYNGITAIEQYRRWKWQDYIDYLDRWTLEHKDITNYGMSPICFDELEDNEEEA